MITNHNNFVKKSHFLSVMQTVHNPDQINDYKSHNFPTKNRINKTITQPLKKRTLTRAIQKIPARRKKSKARATSEKTKRTGGATCGTSTVRDRFLATGEIRLRRRAGRTLSPRLRGRSPRGAGARRGSGHVGCHEARSGVRKLNVRR